MYSYVNGDCLWILGNGNVAAAAVEKIGTDPQIGEYFTLFFTHVQLLMRKVNYQS